MKKIFFLLLVIANSVTAENVDSLFVSANNLYKTNKFEAAIEDYKKIESQDLVSSELYYNLGNCYYCLLYTSPSPRDS